MSLSLTPLLAILDSLAAQVTLFAAAMGSGVEADTISLGAANNVATLLGALDGEVAHLVPAFDERAEAVQASALYGTLGGAAIARALDHHYGAIGGVNAFLSLQDARVHPNVRQLGISIDAPRCFAPTVVHFGDASLAGPDVASYTADAVMDTSSYGRANVVVRALGDIGPSELTATLTLTTLEGGTDTRAVTLPALTASGTAIDVGTHGTDMYIGCTALTVSGGSAGDSFSVETEIERTVAL